MSNLDNAILNSIKEELPAASIDLIQNVFDEFEQLKKDYEVAVVKIGKLEGAIQDKEKDLQTNVSFINDQAEEISTLQDLYDREKEIEKREIKYELRIANIRLEESERRSEDLFMLTDKVMGHPNVTVQRHFNRTGDQDLPVEGGGNGSPGYTVKGYENFNETETTTTTQDKK